MKVEVPAGIAVSKGQFNKALFKLQDVIKQYKIDKGANGTKVVTDVKSLSGLTIATSSVTGGVNVELTFNKIATRATVMIKNGNVSNLADLIPLLQGNPDLIEALRSIS